MKKLVGLFLLFGLLALVVTGQDIIVMRKPATAAGPSSFSDNFNRSDRALDGDNGWSFLAGSADFNIVSNALQVGDDPGDTSVTNSGLSVADGFVQADISLATDSVSVGLIFRVQDTSNFYLIDCTHVGGVAEYYFYKREAGSYTSLGSFTTGGSWSGAATIKVTFVGDDFEVFLNGISETTFTDSTFSAAGPTGIRNGSGGTGARAVDNFTVGQ